MNFQKQYRYIYKYIFLFVLNIFYDNTFSKEGTLAGVASEEVNHNFSILLQIL